jgi:hypothetical protein
MGGNVRAALRRIIPHMGELAAAADHLVTCSKQSFRFRAGLISAGSNLTKVFG